MRYLIIFLMLCGVCFGQWEFNKENYIYAELGGGDASEGAVTAWLQYDTIASFGFSIVAKGDSGERFYFSYFSGGVFSFRFASSSGVAWGTPAPSVLTHYALSWSNGVYAAYISGNVVKQGTYTGSMGTHNRITVGTFIEAIGTTYADYGIDGTIEDPRYYSRWLTAQEIAAISKNPWSLQNDANLLLLPILGTNATGNTLSGAAANLKGLVSFYSNNPTAAPRKIRIRKPMGMIP